MTELENRHAGKGVAQASDQLYLNSTFPASPSLPQRTFGAGRRELPSLSVFELHIMRNAHD